MYEYNNYDYEQNNAYQADPQWEQGSPDPSAPRHSGKKNRRSSTGRGARIAKKAGAITLSALLFGSVASGAFLTINYAAGYRAQTDSASAAAPAQTDTQLLQASASGTAAAASDSTTAAASSLDVSAIADTVMPSIVSITNKSVQEVQNYFSMFGYGGQTQLQESESSGSGIIVGKNDTELLIVTNYHVIEDAVSLSACFIDSSVYEAVVKGTDPTNDLAVIAIPLTDLSADTLARISVAQIGDSDSLKVGEQVVAIGNALGFGQSVTTGIVSATNRTLSVSQTAASADSETDVPTYIQTDAAINPGNSGGALVNMKGELIGINSAKLASTEVEGMGYAIPISRVSGIIENLMNRTTRTKVAESEQGSLGISAVQVSEAVTAAYGIPSGVYVADVNAGSGAEAAGLRKGDVITAFDGENVTDMSQLTELLTYYKAGETVELTVQSIDNGAYAEKTVTVTLGQALQN